VDDLPEARQRSQAGRGEIELPPGPGATPAIVAKSTLKFR
jgi:hypothetical protein